MLHWSEKGEKEKGRECEDWSATKSVCMITQHSCSVFNAPFLSIVSPSLLKKNQL